MISRCRNARAELQPRLTVAGEIRSVLINGNNVLATGLFGAAFTKRTGRWSFDVSGLYYLISTGTQNTNLGDRFLFAGFPPPKSGPRS